MKSPVYVTLAAVGNSVWVPLSYLQAPFGVTMAVMLSGAGNLTYSVQYTYDGQDAANTLAEAVITRTATSANVLWPDHGLVTGDAVITYATGDPNLDSAKDSAGRMIAQDITYVDENNFTYVVANTGLAVSQQPARVRRFRVFTHAVLAALTARADSNFNLPCQMVRLKVTAYTAGKVSMAVTQGSGSGT